jgi:selenide,water dikinase
VSTQGIREVVLVGGGHAHIQVLKQFAEKPPPDARLTLIVDRPVAVYSGMVPGFVAGQYEAHELEIDATDLAGLAGARVVVSPATRIEPDERRIHVAAGPPVAYDVASFDIGSTVGGLDLPGVSEHALPTRPIVGFVERVGELLARAISLEPGRPLRVVVVGGGAGGVELAFALEHRLKSETRADVRVTLLEGGSRVLRRYADSLVRRVEEHARARGIEIRCDQRVASAEAERVVLESGESIDCEALVWVTGPVSHPTFVDSELATDDRGFVRIRSTLQFEEHDDLFAVGDCGTLIDYPETPKAGVYAVREGPVVTKNLLRWLEGKPLEAYRPQGDFLTLLNLGDGRALGTKWGVSFEGRWVMRWKDRIDRKFMSRFQLG